MSGPRRDREAPSPRSSDLSADLAFAHARFVNLALAGMPVDEAREFCESRGFQVLIEEPGGPPEVDPSTGQVRPRGVGNLSFSTGRVRLVVKSDGTVGSASIG
jgi:hypothetical protein